LNAGRLDIMNHWKTREKRRSNDSVLHAGMAWQKYFTTVILYII